MTTDQAPHHDEEDRDGFLVSVLEDHAPILYGIFQKKCGRDSEDAFQEFVLVVLMQRDLLSKLRAIPATDHQRRHLLSKAASDFCIEWRRPQRVRRRTMEQYQPPSAVPQLNVLSQKWAKDILQEAFMRVCDYFNNNGNADHWTVFRERVIQPVYHGAEPTSIENICNRTRFNNRREVYSTIQHVKRRLQLELEMIVVERTGNEVTFEELLHLLR